MILRHKIIFLTALLSVLIGASWYFLLFPQEAWIRYNLIIRANEINALADFWERQDSFREFSCIGDDVRLDKGAAPKRYHEILLEHCRSAQIFRGELMDGGSWYYLGWDSKWLADFWVAAVRLPDLDGATLCSRWQKPDPLDECIVPITGKWAIHYLNVTALGEDVKDFAEEIVQREAGQ